MIAYILTNMSPNLILNRYPIGEIVSTSASIDYKKNQYSITQKI